VAAKLDTSEASFAETDSQLHEGEDGGLTNCQEVLAAQLTVYDRDDNLRGFLNEECLDSAVVVNCS